MLFYRHLASYPTLDAYLGTKLDRPAPRASSNTRIQRRGEDIAIRLHSTDVVCFCPNGSVILDSGRWKTATTRTRMNEYLPQGWFVSQERGVWYLNHWTAEENPHWQFEDGCTINPDDTVSMPSSPRTAKDTAKLIRQIGQYAKGYMAALDAGEVPAPGPGDCWFCYMLPDHMDTDHLESHMDESYYVPSLLVRAMDAYPVSKAAGWYLSAVWNAGAYTVARTAESEKVTWGGIGTRQLSRSLQWYLKKMLGVAT